MAILYYFDLLRRGQSFSGLSADGKAVSLLLKNGYSVISSECNLGP